MNPRIIIYNNSKQRDALLKRLHKKLSKNRSYKASSYATPIDHPTKDEFGAIIEDRSNLAWYDDLIDELTPAERSSIVEATNDWFPWKEL